MTDRMSEEKIFNFPDDLIAKVADGGESSKFIMRKMIRQLRAELAEVKERLQWMTEDRDRGISALAHCGERYEKLKAAVKWVNTATCHYQSCDIRSIIEFELEDGPKSAQPHAEIIEAILDETLEEKDGAE